MAVPDRRVGTQVRCPKCGETVFVPRAEGGESRVESQTPAPPQPPSLPKHTPPPPPPSVSQGGAISFPPPVPQVAAARSEQRVDPKPPLRGLEYDCHTIGTVRQLAAAVAFVALFGAIPAFLEVTPAVQRGALGTAAHWAFLLLFVGALQCAYAAYLAQLPDWGTLWVVTLVTLAVGMTYAMSFGLTLFASDQSQLIQLLDLGDRLRDGKARLWCLTMLILTSLLAYFCGRVCVRWHRDFAAVYR